MALSNKLKKGNIEKATASGTLKIRTLIARFFAINYSYRFQCSPLANRTINAYVIISNETILYYVRPDLMEQFITPRSRLTNHLT